ncbi:CotH kinase family protein [bacterium]|nr:CotH kinase family protein [bacterium]
MYRLLMLFFMLYVSISPTAWAQEQIVINEILASNVSIIADEAGEYDDWIELYNPTGSYIDVGGWFLSDDRENPLKCQLPHGRSDLTRMAPGAYLLIWADGDTTDTALHVSFKLSKSGEWVWLSRQNSIVVDSVSFPAQSSDVSWSRFADGTDVNYSFSSPTPGHPNVRRLTQSVSRSQGVYSEGFFLKISTDVLNGVIRYTTNGADVSVESLEYQAEIEIRKCIILKIRVFDNNQPVTDQTVHTYIIGDDSLPVLSVVIPWGDLWDANTGIYVQYEMRGRTWERPCIMSLFEEGDIKFEVPCGLRIHGNISRQFDKKSLRVHFRGEYGCKNLKYPVFDQLPELGTFDSLILYTGSRDHAACASNYTYLADVLSHSLFSDIGGLNSASKPVILYLNASFWGIYWIRENIDGDYLKNKGFSENADLLRDQFNLYPDIRAGDDIYWSETFEFIRLNDMSLQSNYMSVKIQYIDINSFIDYYITNFFIGNWAWMRENVDRYRDREGDPRWKWIMWDTDVSWRWGADLNIMKSKLEERDSSYPGEYTWYNLIFNKLLANHEFNRQFLNRYADLLNTLFLTDHVLTHLDSMAQLIRDDMRKEEIRWEPSWSYWESNVNNIREFAQLRPEKIKDHILDFFNLAGMFNICIKEPVGRGTIYLNSLKLKMFPFTGDYFQSIPITLRAVPDPGYFFTGWSEPAVTNLDSLSYTLIKDITVQPIFKRIDVKSSVIINEFNYNSHANHDSGDWIELYNPTDDTVDLSGWYIKDSDEAHRYTVPENITIAGHSFFVICRDSLRFQACFPGCTNVIGNLGFGLSGDGDTIMLFDTVGALVDCVTYDDDVPWPAAPDGNGPTLELKDPSFDNAMAESWQASQGHGSPGAANDTDGELSGITDGKLRPEAFQLLQNYPNPFNPETVIEFYLPGDGDIYLSVFDINGRLVYDKNFSAVAGRHLHTWRAIDVHSGSILPSGVYIVMLKSATETRHIKMLLLR